MIGWWESLFLILVLVEADPVVMPFVLEHHDEDFELASALTQEEFVADELVNESHYAGRRLTTNIHVPGRIGNAEFFNFWRDELKASEFVLKTISEGYEFPFSEIPPPGEHKNNKSMIREKDFALAELLRLEKLGCISRVTDIPYLCLPLSVVFSKKLRLLVDASRHLNPFIRDRKKS